MNLKRPEGLNIVPFIDIMLVLLAIVLTISTFIAQGKIKVDLPQASSSVSLNNEKYFEIVIDSQNKIYAQDSLINIHELEDKLKNVDKKTNILLKSDKLSHFENFIKVMDILKTNEYENFHIATYSE